MIWKTGITNWVSNDTVKATTLGGHSMYTQ